MQFWEIMWLRLKLLKELKCKNSGSWPGISSISLKQMDGILLNFGKKNGFWAKEMGGSLSISKIVYYILFIISL